MLHVFQRTCIWLTFWDTVSILAFWLLIKSKLCIVLRSVNSSKRYSWWSSPVCPYRRHILPPLYMHCSEKLGVWLFNCFVVLIGWLVGWVLFVWFVFPSQLVVQLGKLWTIPLQSSLWTLLKQLMHIIFSNVKIIFNCKLIFFLSFFISMSNAQAPVMASLGLHFGRQPDILKSLLLPEWKIGYIIPFQHVTVWTGCCWMKRAEWSAAFYLGFTGSFLSSPPTSTKNTSTGLFYDCFLHTVFLESSNDKLENVSSAQLFSAGEILV